MDLVSDDVLSFDHTRLDQNCVKVIQAIWPRLQSQTGQPSESEVQTSVDILRKLAVNYSNVHQLPRFTNKLLDALRTLSEGEGLTVYYFPALLYELLCKAFSDASEQQMLTVMTNLVKEAVLYFVETPESTGHALEKLKFVSQLLWTAMRSMRIRSTTRQEVIRNVCTQYVEMRRSLIKAAVESAGRSSHPELIYVSLILTHAWVGFQVILKDLVELSSKEPIKLIRRCLKLLQEPAERFQAPELNYWFHRIALQTCTLDKFPVPFDKHRQDVVFPWGILYSATENSNWDGCPFSISVESLPVALWSGLVSNYCFLPTSVTSHQHSEFAAYLVRTLVVMNVKTGVSTTSPSFCTLSNDFVRSGTLYNIPALQVGLLKSLEKLVRETLDENDVVAPRPKKRVKRKENIATRTGQLLRSLQIIEKIGFNCGATEFSFSLIWKAIEYVLTTKGNRPFAANESDLCSISSMERSLFNIVTSLPNYDFRYWKNVLLDFEKLRQSFLLAAHDNPSDLGIFNTFLDFVHIHEYDLVMLIAGAGRMEGLADLWDTVKDLKTPHHGLLYPILLDVLLIHAHYPNSMRIYDEVMVVALMMLESAAVHLFESLETAGRMQIKTFSICADSIRRSLKKLRPMEGFKKRTDLVVQVLASTLNSVRLRRAFERAKAATESAELDAALKFVSLYIDANQSCRTKLGRKIVRLMVPSTDTGRIVDDGMEYDATELVEEADETEVLKRLEQIVSLPLARDRRVRQRPHSRFLELLRESREYFSLFCQMMRYADAEKISKELFDLGEREICAGDMSEESVRRETLFFGLTASCPALPELTVALRPVFELMLQRLSRITSMMYVKNETVSSASSILHSLMRSTYSREAANIALSEPVYSYLLQKSLSDADFTDHFQNCSVILNEILRQSRLVSLRTVPSFIKAASLWLIGILQRARQDEREPFLVCCSRKAMMIRNSSFVERLLGNVAKHKQFFSKLVIHLIAVYCAEVRNGTLYPEAKEHITAGLYRLLDIIDPHSKVMGNAAVGVESREIYKTLIEDHIKFHKYRGLV